MNFIILIIIYNNYSNYSLLIFKVDYLFDEEQNRPIVEYEIYDYNKKNKN